MNPQVMILSVYILGFAISIGVYSVLLDEGVYEDNHEMCYLLFGSTWPLILVWCLFYYPLLVLVYFGKFLAMGIFSLVGSSK